MEATMLEASLTEWALNTEVSIPAFPRIFFSQLANRVSELQALDLRYRIYRPEGVSFQRQEEENWRSS